MSSDSTPEREPRVFESWKKRYETNRDYDANASWRDWLWHRYAKTWYGVGSLVLDGMVVGVILQSTDPTQVWPYAVAIALAAGLVYLEYLGLRRFWPPKSPG